MKTPPWCLPILAVQYAGGKVSGNTATFRLGSTLFVRSTMPSLRVDVNGLGQKDEAESAVAQVVGRSPHFANKGKLVWNSLPKQQADELAVLLRKHGLKADVVL